MPVRLVVWSVWDSYWITALRPTPPSPLALPPLSMRPAWEVSLSTRTHTLEFQCGIKFIQFLMAVVNFRCKTCQAQHCVVCISGNADCVKLLINTGACLEAYDLYYGTPLLVACVNQHIDCVKVLLNAGECKARLATSYWMALRRFLAYLFAVTLFISVGWPFLLTNTNRAEVLKWEIKCKKFSEIKEFLVSEWGLNTSLQWPQIETYLMVKGHSWGQEKYLECVTPSFIIFTVTFRRDDHMGPFQWLIVQWDKLGLEWGLQNVDFLLPTATGLIGRTACVSWCKTLGYCASLSEIWCQGFTLPWKGRQTK